MANCRSLYLRLKGKDLIQEEKMTMQPGRRREKVMGFMWEGEMELVTKDGLKFKFFFWHHFHDDDGESWYPSQKELDEAWTTRFVPEERSPTAKLCDASWHTIYHDDHIYVSKKGTFGFEGKKKEDIVASIQNGSWELDPDLWMLI